MKTISIIAAALALGVPAGAFAAGDCCKGMECCKDGKGDCCKDMKKGGHHHGHAPGK